MDLFSQHRLTWSNRQPAQPAVQRRPEDEPAETSSHSSAHALPYYCAPPNAPDQFVSSSHLTESPIEGDPGFFGRWVEHFQGALPGFQPSSSALANALDEVAPPFPAPHHAHSWPLMHNELMQSEANTWAEPPIGPLLYPENSTNASTSNLPEMNPWAQAGNHLEPLTDALELFHLGNEASSSTHHEWTFYRPNNAPNARRSTLSNGGIGKAERKKSEGSSRQAANPYPRLPEDMVIPRFNFPTSFKHIIRAMLTQSTYGKNWDRLLAPNSKFQAVSVNGDFMLVDYHEPPQTQAPYIGICNELAYSIGKQVQHILGNTFEVKVATGTCKQYFPHGTHYFLLAWPKSKSQQIEKELSKNQNIPKGCFLIDPSFKEMIPPSVMKNRKDYQMKNVKDLEDFNPANMKEYSYNRGNYPVTLPIGLTREVVPEAIGEYGDKSMLFIKFDANSELGKAPFVLPVVQRQPTVADQEVADALFNHVGLENQFAAFYHKIVNELHPPEAEVVMDVNSPDFSQQSRLQPNHDPSSDFWVPSPNDFTWMDNLVAAGTPDINPNFRFSRSPRPAHMQTR